MSLGETTIYYQVVTGHKIGDMIHWRNLDPNYFGSLEDALKCFKQFKKESPGTPVKITKEICQVIKEE